MGDQSRPETNWWMVTTVSLLTILVVITVAFFYSYKSKGDKLSSDCISASEAKSFIGEVRSVCGKVVDTKYSTRSRRQPTFLNLDQPFPTHEFTVVIWGKDRDKFGVPEEVYKGKQIMVTGTIAQFKGKSQIIVTEISQIKVVN